MTDLAPWESGYESTTFRWLTSTMIGWYRAWKSVAEAFGSTSCRDRESGETWEYMGTVDGRHEFRHRSYRGRSRNHYVPILCDDFDVHDGECYTITTDCLGSNVYARC